jgi:deoxyadenosine/deoxycytidine kinase
VKLLVAVSGNLGSGKSTVARLLAKNAGLKLADSTGYEKSYLTDLFSDPGRWSFEAQMAFLCAKAWGVKRAFDTASRVVVDRSLAEDVEIFARYFVDNGYLGERAYRTYVALASLVEGTVPRPKMFIYCRCPPDISRQRLDQRPPRPYQLLYPKDFLDSLHEAYERWWGQIDADAKIDVDTHTIDLRSSDAASTFLRRIVADMEDLE